MKLQVLIALLVAGCSGGGIVEAGYSTGGTGSKSPPPVTTPWKAPPRVIVEPVVDPVPTVQTDAGTDDVDSSVPDTTPPEDAGVPVVVDSGNGDSGSSPLPVVCNAPTAFTSDARNWFTTNRARVNEWFQLSTPEGFSADRCTYTGSVVWFRQGTDGYWESNGSYDHPLTTFVFQFNLDGTIVVDSVAPTGGYPQGHTTGSNVDYVGGCRVGLLPNNPLVYDLDYKFHNCIVEGATSHDLYLNVFAGSWVTDHPAPVQPIIPPNRG
jgi:hypothetical protein